MELFHIFSVLLKHIDVIPFSLFKKNYSSFIEFFFSIDFLRLLDEPLNAIKQIPEPVTARTRLDVSYPMTEAAKSLNVVRCKEIVEKRTSMQMICNKRFLKPTVVSHLVSYFEMY